MEPLLAYAVPFGFVMIRTVSFMIVVPVFGWSFLPWRLKVTIAVVASTFFAASLGVPEGLDALPLPLMVLAAAGEVVHGAALGLAIAILFVAARFGGRFIERQMGMALASMVNPTTQQRSGAVDAIYDIVAAVLFLSVNGHHAFLLILERSFQSFPLGSTPTPSVLLSGIVEATAVSFVLGLRVAAPIIVMLFMISVVLGLMAKMVPEMNILFTSLPARCGVGMLGIALFISRLAGLTDELLSYMGRILPL